MAIKNSEKNQYKKGQSGNPNGRPKKSFATINAELERNGVKPISKSDLVSAYAFIFNSTEDDLIKISKDQETPYAFRLIILELHNKSTRSKALIDFRDYLFGKAKETKEVITPTNKIKLEIVNRPINKNDN